MYLTKNMLLLFWLNRAELSFNARLDAESENTTQDFYRWSSLWFFF